MRSTIELGKDTFASIQSPSSGSASRAKRSEEHTSELQSPCNLVCRLLLEKKNNSPACRANDYELATHRIRPHHHSAHPVCDQPAADTSFLRNHASGFPDRHIFLPASSASL